MTRKEAAGRIYTILTRAYPDARVTLDFRSPLQLLIATILAAQCTDERVNIVTKELFRRYRTARAFAEADQAELEEAIRSTGFYRSKAKNIIACCGKLVREFQGQVPRRMEELITLPGVWRKTANIVLANAFGIPGLAVDTHVTRVSNRLGLAKSEDPDEIEEQLCKLFPKEDWGMVTHLLVFHGRKVCQAKKPQCPICPVRGLCRWPGKRKVLAAARS